MSKEYRVSSHMRKYPSRRAKKAAAMVIPAPIMLLGGGALVWWLASKYRGYYPTAGWGQTVLERGQIDRDPAHVWRSRIAQVPRGAPGYRQSQLHLYATGQTPTGPGGVWRGWGAVSPEYQRRGADGQRCNATTVCDSGNGQFFVDNSRFGDANCDTHCMTDAEIAEVFGKPGGLFGSSLPPKVVIPLAVGAGVLGVVVLMLAYSSLVSPR